MDRRYPIDKKVMVMVLMFFIITVLLLLNLFNFINIAASPIIRDDAWYFIDSQIAVWISEGFSWSDIFIKRDLTDHAQPLNKLLLYLNYSYFDLDFRVESLVGILGLFLSLLLCVSIHIKEQLTRSAGWVGAGFLLLAILILLSLNSTELYSWSLVTFSFLPFSLALLTPLMAWSFLQTSSLRNPALLLSPFVVGLVFVLIGDTASIICWLSLTLSLVLIAFSDRTLSQKRLLIWILLSSLIVLSYFLILNFNFLGRGSAAALAQNRLDIFNIHFYLEIIKIVFSESLIHFEHMDKWGVNRDLFSWLVAIPLLCFYLWHFGNLVVKKQKQSVAELLVTFILVYATVSIMAIIVGRVPEYGINYLYQPRYVFVYQLIPFALFLKLSFYCVNHKLLAMLNKVILIVFLPLMLFAQWQFNLEAYKAAPWISRLTEKQAEAVAQYVMNPNLKTGECNNYSLNICTFPEKRRTEILNLLIDSQLNIFNADFQWKYRIFPFSGVKPPKVDAWGPDSVDANASNGIWVKLSDRIIDARATVLVKFRDEVIENVVFEKDLITFAIPDNYKSIPGIYEVSYFIAGRSETVPIGKLEIKNTSY